MFLKERSTGHLVEVLSLDDLFNPAHTALKGRYNVGEDLPEPETFQKAGLEFLSGEPLPRCWTDVHYRESAA